MTTARRNDPCPCGSGQKFKNCCQSKTDPGLVAPKTRAGPASGDDLRRQAVAHHQAGRLELAVDCYEQAIAKDRKDADALFGLGQAWGQLNNTARAIELIKRAISLKGSHAIWHVRLADLLLRTGDMGEATQRAARGAELDPRSSAAWCMLALCYERSGKLDEALKAAGTAISLEPDHADSVSVMARVLRRSGDLERALRCTENVADRVKVPEQRRRILFERARALDDLGQYEQAFETYRASHEAAEQTFAAQRIDRDLEFERIERYAQVVTRDLLARFATPPADDFPAPVFLIGFPRSGTTMTEQILASHPDIQTVDEKPILRAVKDVILPETDRRRIIADALGSLTEKQIQRLRATYWKRAREFVDIEPKKKVLVDKLPLNIVDVGLINVIFPESKLIVALRDPRDACISCFTQMFGLNTSMINFLSLEGAVQFYRAVMGYWLSVREHLTTPWIEVRYEDTVRDLKSQAQRMLDFLEVPWDESVLSFHEQARNRFISTPSYTAVTDPVHTRAIGRWQRYPQARSALEPLQQFIGAFGYAEQDTPLTSNRT